MIGTSSEIKSLADGLRRYAAMADAFDPVAALHEVADAETIADPLVLVEVLSSLRPDCTIEKGADGDRWLMRPGARRKVLAQMGSTSVLGASEAKQAPTSVKAAVAGDGSFAPDEIDRIVGEEADPVILTDMVVALERAGPNAPGFDKLVAVRSALNRVRQADRNDNTLATGFFGRQEELKRLDDWIRTFQNSPPLRTVHVSGLPGIGKSFLLERVIQKARREMNPILVRLDFDRSSLHVLDAYALFEEISRQIGDSLPSAAVRLRELRLKSAEEAAALADMNRRSGFPRELLALIGESVRKSERAILIILDTLEVLRSAGETHVMTLFDQLDLLVEFGVDRISIISAGRGDALGSVSHRIMDSIALGGLEDHAARELLKKRQVAPALWPRILPLARGNPLLLTLAAKAMETEDFNEDDLPEGASDEAIAGYLYRAILSRVPKELHGIANEGLILRRINPETLVGIVAPTLGLTLDREAAAKMLTTLSKQHWLVQPDQGWLQHRPDIRSAILELIYQAHPATTAEIDRRAAEWFAESDPLTSLYHALQTTRTGADMPHVSTELAAGFTGHMLGDLPSRARDAVLQARGERSGYGRAMPTDSTSPEKAAVVGRRVAQREIGATTRAVASHARYDRASKQIVFIDRADGESSPPPDERALRDMEIMLEKGDYREASFVLANGFDVPFAVDGDAAVIVLTHQWKTGHWSVVKRMLRLMSGRVLDRSIKRNPVLLGRVMLEVWAEFRFDELVSRLGSPDFFEKAALITRDTAHVGLAGGALEIALMCAAPDDAPTDFFPNAFAALAPAMTDRPPETVFDALQRANALRESMNLSLSGLDASEAPTAPERLAEAMMPLNPYAAPIEAHVRDAEDGKGGVMLEYLDQLRPVLSRAAYQFAPDVTGVADLESRLASGPADVAQALAVVGLAAEWADGFSFYRPVPDLPTIADAAERWRRTVNGMWSYGRHRPPGWRQDRDTDWATAALTERIMSAADPAAQAERTLRFWADPLETDPEFGRAQARRRLLHRYRDALDLADNTPLRALGFLQRSGVLGTLAAPLAVLAALGKHPDDVLPEGPKD